MGVVKYTGPVASFHCPTNAEIRSLKVHFSPKQEGSGDPSPENVRPISGWTGVTINSSNKNMFDLNWMLLSSGTLVDGVLTDTAANLLNSFSESIKPIPNTRYNDCITISITAKTDASSSSTGRGFTIKVAYDDGTYSNLIYFSNSSTSYTTVSATSTSGKKVIALHCDYGSGGANIWNIKDFQVELSATATPYEPYHGSTTNYEFGVLGKNKFDYTNANIVNKKRRDDNGNVVGDSTGSYCQTLIPVKPNTIYTVSGYAVNNGSKRIYYIDAEENFIARTAAFGASSSYTFTTPNNCYYIQIQNREVGENASWETVQLELGSSATTYEPYDPNHTVYGGWVDLITGEVCEEMKCVIIDGTQTIQAREQYENSNFFQIPRTQFEFIPEGYHGDEICSYFKSITNITQSADYYPWIFFINVITKAFRFSFPTSYNLTAVQNFFIEHPTQICYYITPITYYLAPIQLQTFLGQNNVWSNADYVEVEYDLHETQNILARKQFIIANQPHIVKPAAAPLQNFVTDVAAPVKECKVYFSPMQEGEGDPSPDNVRAISGWTGCEVYRTKTNLFPEVTLANFENYATKGNYGYWYTNPIYLTPNTVYHLDWTRKTSDSDPLCFWGIKTYSGMNYDVTDAGTFQYYCNGANGFRSYASFNSGPTGIIRFALNKQSSQYSTAQDALDDLFAKATFMLTVGTTAIPYEPYSGTTLPIDWTAEAGTVYGGYVDLVTGEVWETWDIIDLGTCTWIQYSNNPSIFYTRSLNNLKEKSNQYTVLCTTYPYEQQVNVTATNDKTINDSQQLNLGNIAIRDTNYAESTPAEFKEAMNGVICAYKLATPQLVTTLTTTQLKTLRGTNNIWSSANGDVEIAYWAH